MKRGCLRLIGLAVVMGAAAIGGGILGRERLLIALGNYLIVEDELRYADVIHVIAGDDYRTDYAIQLYKQGYGGKIFFTGGWCKFHGYLHGEHGRLRAVAQGVPNEAIAFDDTTVKSTYDEALRLKEYIDNNPALANRSVLVVSDPFHMRRSQWVYQRIFGHGITVWMAPVPFEQTPYQQRWWEEPQSRDYVAAEYKKLAYYVARYQLSWGWVKVWLESLDTE